MTDPPVGDYTPKNGSLSCVQVCSDFSLPTLFLFENFLTFTGACAHTGEKWVTILIKKRDRESGPKLEKDKQRGTTVIYCRGLVHLSSFLILLRIFSDSFSDSYCTAQFPK